MMKIMGIKTDLMADPAEFVETKPGDDHFFFFVKGNDKRDDVHYYAYMDGKMIFEGGTDIDEDGSQNVRFDIPKKFQKPGEYEIEIELYDRDDERPIEDKELIDSGFYTLVIK